MSYETRAFDGEPNDPTVVIVVRGQHDVSRLINLFAGGVNTVEQLQIGKHIRAQLKRSKGGRAAMQLLAAHGGPDFLAGERDYAWHTLRRFTGPGLLDPGDVDQYELLHPEQCRLLPPGAVCWALHEPFRWWWPTENGSYRIRPEDITRGGDEDGPNIETTLRIQVRNEITGTWSDYDGDTLGAEPDAAKIESEER